MRNEERGKSPPIAKSGSTLTEHSHDPRRTVQRNGFPRLFDPAFPPSFCGKSNPPFYYRFLHHLPLESIRKGKSGGAAESISRRRSPTNRHQRELLCRFGGERRRRKDKKTLQVPNKQPFPLWVRVRYNIQYKPYVSFLADRDSRH